MRWKGKHMNREVFTIAVTCSVPPQHRGRVTDVDLFGNADDGRGWSMWPNPDRGLIRVTDKGTAVNVIDPAQHEMTGRANRARFDMRCKLCGLTAVARLETMNVVLDKLRHAGVRTIELTHLVAILSK